MSKSFVIYNTLKNELLITICYRYNVTSQ